FLVYSHINHQLTDSVKNARYDWLGQRHTTMSGSEMGTDLSKLGKPVIETNLHNVTYRGLFKYDLKDNQQLILNIVNNYFTRTSDDLNKYHTQTHIKYNRFIAGLGYRYSFFDQRMEALSQVKFLVSHTRGNIDNSITGEQERPVQNSGWSFAQSLKYNSYNGWLLRPPL